MKTRNIDELRKDLVFSAELMGSHLTFHTTWGLFSPKHIDDGSSLLLQQLEVNSSEQIVDLGCGYGVLGIALAKAASAGSCLMLDKDFVAVEYARKNALINRADNCTVRLSNGLQAVDGEQFTLAVSNLPAKTSNEQYSLFFHDVRAALMPGGRFVFVSISGIRQFVARICRETFGNYEKVKQGKVHTVGLARVP